jgi:predicted RNase H-like nuclease
MQAMSIGIAGVDGCPAGWLIVLRTLRDGEPPRVALANSFADVLVLTRDARIVAVDSPIGLPERSGIGGRPADIAARANLGARQSAVFAVPARAAVMETDYRRACAVALAHSDPPRKVSKQTFNLFPKIREVDRLMTPALQERIVECHPEAAFWAMNGERPLKLAKKIKSRPSAAGLALRRGLLEAAGFQRAFIEARHFRAIEAGADDLLDACACCWTAARVLAGTARRFPHDPAVDARGLRQEIRA